MLAMFKQHFSHGQQSHKREIDEIKDEDRPAFPNFSNLNKVRSDDGKDLCLPVSAGSANTMKPVPSQSQLLTDKMVVFEKEFD